jgi:hypothetical protein
MHANTKYVITIAKRKVIVSKYLSLPESSIEISDEEAFAITTWVQEAGIGRRVAYNQWQLGSDKAVSMFMLKYG